MKKMKKMKMKKIITRLSFMFEIKKVFKAKTWYFSFGFE